MWLKLHATQPGRPTVAEKAANFEMGTHCPYIHNWLVLLKGMKWVSLSVAVWLSYKTKCNRSWWRAAVSAVILEEENNIEFGFIILIGNTSNWQVPYLKFRSNEDDTKFFNTSWWHVRNFNPTWLVWTWTSDFIRPKVYKMISNFF